MSELREKWREQIANLQAAFGRLTQQEQLVVLGMSAGFVLLFLLGIGFWVGSAIDGAERRVKDATDKLNEVILLQGDYKQRESQRQAKLAELSRSTVRLVSLVEDSAKQAGVEIPRLTPEDKQPNADGIVESIVELKATNLSADRLQDFLNRLEKAPGVVILRRIKLQRPYRKDAVDLEMTVATYRKG